MHRIAAPVVAAALLLTACVGGDTRRAATTTTSDMPPTTVAALPELPNDVEPGTGAVPVSGPVTASDLCDAAVPEATPATVGSPASDDAAELVEISGVAASRAHPEVLWVHNDSGFPPEIAALDRDGNVIAVIPIPGVESVDWEDVALGRGADQFSDTLFIGDIGDNTDEPVRGTPPVIIRIAEPDPFAPPGASIDAVSIPYAYADGPRDAEAVLADPLTGEVVIVSKQWSGAIAGAYVIPAEVAFAEEPPPVDVTLPRAADVGGTEGSPVTGGDISPDGRIVILRTYIEVLVWDRDPADSVAATLATEPTCTRQVIEPQGEAVAIGVDGRGFVTISEGRNPPINWHRVPA